MRLVSASLFCSSNSSSNIDLLPDFECVKFTSHWTWTMATSNYSVCVTLKFASKLPQCGSKWFWNCIRNFMQYFFKLSIIETMKNEKLLSSSQHIFTNHVFISPNFYCYFLRVCEVIIFFFNINSYISLFWCILILLNWKLLPCRKNWKSKQIKFGEKNCIYS